MCGKLTIDGEVINVIVALLACFPALWCYDLNRKEIKRWERDTLKIPLLEDYYSYSDKRSEKSLLQNSSSVGLNTGHSSIKLYLSSSSFAFSLMFYCRFLVADLCGAIGEDSIVTLSGD